MNRRDTGALQDELMTAPDLGRFLAENSEIFVHSSFSELLQKIFLEKGGLTKAELARRSCMSEVYLHQLFAGGRNPSRNRIICLCFGLGATVEEAQELLKHSGSAQLYARSRRDAVILYGLMHGLDLAEINDALFHAGEATLC